MANAVFNSYEDYLSKDTSNPVQHNTFDLSHIRNFTTTYGALIPFYLEDCVPSDHFKISNVVKVQSLPMANPLFNNIKVQTWYFYVPYYLLWRKFDLFISGGRDGTYSAVFPFTQIYPSHNSLGDYLGLPTPYDYTPVSTGFFKVSAFPFAAYQRIYRDYFMNQDLQTSTNTNSWFPADDDDFTLADGVNYVLGKSGFSSFSFRNSPVSKATYDGTNYYGLDMIASSPSVSSGADRPLLPDESKDLPILQLIRFKNFKRDYFTSAMFSPQRGPAMGLSSTNVSPFLSTDFASIVKANGLPISDMALGSIVIDSNDNKLGALQLNNPTTTGWSSNLTHFLARLGNAYSAKISSAITISDIMTASQVQLWMERNMQVKAQYNEFLRVHFGDAPLDERLTKPYYIGGTSQYINVSAVVQTSESGNTPQGTMTGLGSTQDSQFVGSFTSHEYGLILGIMCIMPDIYYVQGLERVWSHSTKFDFYFPEFAQLPPEPILNKEIWYSTSTDADNDGVFGYSGRYDFMRHRRSTSVGDLRNPQMRDFSSWVINRRFTSLPTLNSWNFFCTLKSYGGVPTIPARRYLETADNVDYYAELNNISMDHFPTGNTQNPFLVQVGLNISASRPLPFRNEPQTLNLRRG